MHRIGPYELIAETGAGSAGGVCQAREPGTGRTVALKLFRISPAADSETRARWVREAKACSSLEHPNVAPVLEIGEAAGWLFVAREWMSGVDLDQFIREARLAPLHEKLERMAQVCDALEHAHRNGILHRDVKPSNIFLRQGQPLAVLDFGLARLPSARTALATRTPGTPNYFSPELIQRRPCDSRTDIFSAAVVFLELLTNSHPFQHAFVPKRIVESLPESPRIRNPQVPLELERLLMRALEKDPDRRIQTAGELGYELREIARFLRTGQSAPAASAVVLAQAPGRPTFPREPRVPAGAAVNQATIDDPADRRVADLITLMGDFDALLTSWDLDGAGKLIDRMSALQALDGRFALAIADCQQRLDELKEAPRPLAVPKPAPPAASLRLAAPPRPAPPPASSPQAAPRSAAIDASAAVSHPNPVTVPAADPPLPGSSSQAPPGFDAPGIAASLSSPAGLSPQSAPPASALPATAVSAAPAPPASAMPATAPSATPAPVAMPAAAAPATPAPVAMPAAAAPATPAPAPAAMPAAPASAAALPVPAAGEAPRPPIPDTPATPPPARKPPYLWWTAACAGGFLCIFILFAAIRSLFAPAEIYSARPYVATAVVAAPSAALYEEEDVSSRRITSLKRGETFRILALPRGRGQDWIPAQVVGKEFPSEPGFVRVADLEQWSSPRPEVLLALLTSYAPSDRAPLSELTAYAARVRELISRHPRFPEAPRAAVELARAELAVARAGRLAGRPAEEWRRHLSLAREALGSASDPEARAMRRQLEELSSFIRADRQPGRTSTPKPAPPASAPKAPSSSSSDWLRRVNAAWSDGDYPAAMRSISRALAANPRDAEALKWKARVQRAQEAEAALSK